MAKNAKVATKKESGMVIYLKNGIVAKVQEGSEVSLGDFEDAIVVGVKNAEINSLNLYRGNMVRYEVNSAYINAFEYECSCGRGDFLDEIDKLRESFLKNVEKSCLKQSEDLDIKKFLYATYVQAKEKVN